MREYTLDRIVRESTKKTDSKIISEWDDPPKEGCTKDDWPYPNHYVKTEITGPMATAIREKLKVTAYDYSSMREVPVYLIEITVSDGYSEFTQEDFQYIRIECAGQTFEFGDREMTSPAFARMMKWLEAPEPDRG